MTESPALSLVQAVRATLRLAENSTDLLDASQLSVIQAGLHKTLKVIDQKMEEIEKHQKVVHDVEDWNWEDSDTDDTADGEEMGTGEEAHGPLPIPGPYPVTLQPGQESADVYYVVSHGREVGIFTDDILSTHAIAGISNGHQVAVGTWYEAAILYNRLWNEALIIRVRD